MHPDPRILSKYWSYTFEFTIFHINGMPAPVLNNISPLKMLYHKFPNYSIVFFFLCVCLIVYVYHACIFITDEKWVLSSHCIFLGYPDFFNGYLYMNLTLIKYLFVILYNLDKLSLHSHLLLTCFFSCSSLEPQLPHSKLIPSTIRKKCLNNEKNYR